MAPTKKSRTSKSTNDNAEDPSDTACSDSTGAGTAAGNTPSAESSIRTESALQDEENEQPLDKNDDGESTVVRGAEQQEYTIETPLVVAASEKSDEATNEGGQDPTQSSPPATALAIQRNANIAALSPNLPADDAHATMLRRILAQHHVQQAQAQAQSPHIMPSPTDQMLDQQSLYPTLPLMGVPGIPLVLLPQVPPQQPSTLHSSSLLESLHLSQSLLPNLQLFPQTSSTVLPQAPTPHLHHLNPTLLGQPQLASSLTQNFPAHLSQAQATAAAAQLQLGSLLASAGQTNSNLYVQPSPLALSTMHMLDHLAASSNHQFVRHVAYPSQLIQSQEHTSRVEQLVSLLLSQQQLGITNSLSTAVPTPSYTIQELQLLRQLNADPESNARLAHVASAAVQPPFIHSIPNPQLDNAMIDQRFGSLDAVPSMLHLGSQSSIPASTAAASTLGSVFLNSIPNQLARNPTLDQRLYTDQVSSSLPGPGHSKEKRWMIRYEELKQFQEVRQMQCIRSYLFLLYSPSHRISNCLILASSLSTLNEHKKYGHCRVPHGYEENRKLSWWVMNQRAQYQMLKKGKPSWLSEDRVALLDRLGFDWNPIIGKSCKR
jgi:hypothetical protein